MTARSIAAPDLPPEMYDDGGAGGLGTICAGGYQYAAGGSISTGHKTGPCASGGSNVS
jgi:hypothetical protein